MDNITENLTIYSKITVARIIQSDLFRWARGIFNFAIRFTLTRIVSIGLFSGGSIFGYVLGIVVIPIAVALDIFVLLLGLASAGIMFLLGFSVFPVLLIWLLFTQPY